MDGRTDRKMDKASYGVACPQVKIGQSSEITNSPSYRSEILFILDLQLISFTFVNPSSHIPASSIFPASVDINQLLSLRHSYIDVVTQPRTYIYIPNPHPSRR